MAQTNKRNSAKGPPAYASKEENDALSPCAWQPAMKPDDETTGRTSEGPIAGKESVARTCCCSVVFGAREKDVNELRSLVSSDSLCARSLDSCLFSRTRRGGVCDGCQEFPGRSDFRSQP
jgi:hypothetical protein